MKKIKYLCLILALTSCSQMVEEEKSYDYPNHAHILWEDIFNKEGTNYYVYFYDPYCGYCKKIKNDLLSFYYQNKLIMYFVDITNYTVIGSGVDCLLGVSKIEDFYITGTPFLININNKQVVTVFAGYNAIQIFIYN